MGWTSASLVVPKLHVETSTEGIEALGSLLFEQGYVRELFIQAVIDREQVFATGLPTPEVQVAIPHADVEHVRKSAIALGLLTHPVEFGEMGNPEGKVKVSVICMLAVRESDSLVSLLKTWWASCKIPPFYTRFWAQATARRSPPR